MKNSQSIIQRFAVLTFALSFAIAGLAHSRQANAQLNTQQLPSGPRIWLQDNHSLTVENLPAVFSDAPAAGLKPLSNFGSISQSQPVAMISGDLDADGIDDLAVGYRSGTGGFVSILKGNLDAFAPQSEESFNAIARSEFPAPFLSQAKTFAVPVSPDFIAIGNFAGNGRQDLIFAAKGGTSLYLMAGDGKGNFATPKPINLDGAVTSLSAGRFGTSALPTLLVGLKGSSGYTIALYAFTSSASSTSTPGTSITPGGFTKINQLPISGAASSISFGRLYKGSFDAAFVAGGTVVLLNGVTQKLETLALPLSARAIALGNYIFDRYPGLQIAVLASDGSVQFAVHGQFDPRVYTAEEWKLVRQASRQNKPNPLLKPVTDSDWKIVEVQTHFASSQALSAPVFFRSRVSGHGEDDLVLLNAAPGRYAILSHPDPKQGTETFPQAELSLRSYAGSPIAALPMRLNVDGRPGIVALHTGEVAPSAIMPIPDPTFNVNTTSDGVYPGSCAANTPNKCTLREAILELSSGGDTIMVPAGTYYLTIGRPGTQDYSGNTGALYVNNPATIVGAGQNSTFIEWGAPSGGTVDTIMAVNEDLNTPFTNATASISSLTMRNAVNNGTYVGLDGDGGAMMFDTGLSGNNTLTLTNVTLSGNKTTDGDGGGIALFNSNDGTGAATLTNCIIENNTAQHSTPALDGSGDGGGIFVGEPSSLVMNNTQVTGNQAVQTNGTYGQGGGLWLSGQTGLTNVGTTTIHGSTISGNTSSGLGGGIYSVQGLTINQGTVISGNTAGQDGGGIWYLTPAGYTLNVSDSTITGNTATTGYGGGIRLDNLAANSATLHFNRLAGNIAGASTTAGNNLSVDPGVTTGNISATENWWGTLDPASTIDNTGSDKATYTPYLVLTHTSNPQSIAVNGTATLTAAIDSDSAGAAISSGNLTAFNGVGVTFSNPSLGTLSAAGTSLNSSGQATATFTATTAESFPNDPFGTADATVDGVAVPVNSSTVASASETGSTVTIYTIGANGFTASELFIAGGISPSGYNTPTDSYSTVTSASATQLAYTDSTTGLGAAGAAGTVNAGIQITAPKIPPTIAISFSPSVVTPGTSSTMTYTITNNMASTIDASFSDTLPSGLSINVIDNTHGCGGTVNSAGSTINFTNASFPASASCTIIVNLYSNTDGIYTNSVTIDSVAAGNGNTASATLIVANPPTMAKSFGPASIPVSATTSLTLIITNPNSTYSFTSLNFNDAFPAGIVVASPNNLTNSCGGTVTATPGTSLVAFSGGSLNQSASCIISVTVTATAVGSLINSVQVNDTVAGNGNTANAVLNVVAATTTTSVTSSANPSVFGQSVTFTATVTPNAPASGTPNGTVEFMNYGNPISGCVAVVLTGGVNSGTATCTTSALAVGSANITANFTSGSSSYQNSYSALFIQIVNPASTTTGVTSSENPSVYGQSVTFTATVAPFSPGAGTPTGIVNFFYGGVPLTVCGAVSLNSSGVATCTTTTLPVGSNNLTATYNGSGNFNISSGGLPNNPQVVNQTSTTNVVTSSANPSTLGQSVTITATITPLSPGAGTPTGLVTFYDGGTPIGSGSLSAGVVSYTTSALAVGVHSITAKYNGDSNFLASTGLLIGNPQVVNQGSTSTNLTSSLNPSNYGQSVTFTATVSATPPASSIPTGTVTFLDGGVSIGTGTLTGGVATFPTSALAAGNHTITISYSGDGNFTGSTGSLTGNPQVVNATTTTTSVAASQSTITLGDTVTFTATVTSSAGPATGLVTFFDGNIPLGTGTLIPAGGNAQATFSTAVLSAAASPHSITATYQSVTDFLGSTATPISETVNTRTTSTGLVLNPASVVVGQSSTATATLTDSGSLPAGTPDAFTTTGPPSTGRTGFSSTLIADGMLLVAGGTDSTSTILQNAEIYSVSGAAFSATGNLITARTGAVAALLPNGNVFVAGGSSDGTANGALNSAELFNPATGAFTSSTNTLLAARFGATATLLNNGNLLIAGGVNSGGVLNSAELYNPNTDSFTATGNLNAARTGATATLLGNGKVLIAGGSSDGTANNALNSAEIFDPAGNAGAGTFTPVAGTNPTLTTGRWQPQAALLLNGTVLIAGGADSTGALTSADLYDPVADSFTASSQQMSQARANGSAVAMPNGMVLLAGGSTSQAVDLYDPDSDKFDSTGNLLQSDNGLVSTLLNNGQVLVVGMTSASTPVSDAELYSPSFNPLGTIALSSSEPTDAFTGACVLTPSTATTSTCNATVTPVNVATSPHTITGTYPADTVHTGSNNTASLTVNLASTTTSLTSSLNPSTLGQSVTFTATISPLSPGAGTPTGTVTFLDGGTSIGTGTLTGGIATFSTSTLIAGNHTITASYGGDGNFIGSTGSLTGNPQVVNTGSATTLVTSSVNPSVIGQVVTFTATLTAVAPAPGSPTGTVTFLDGGTSIGTGTLSGGIATFSTSTLIAGNHTITTSYPGDSSFSSSTGALNSNPQVVIMDSSKTSLTSSTNPSVFGQNVTFTATITAVAPATGTPTGNVTFFDGGVSIGTGTLSGGIATFSTSALLAGSHSITATYNGDSNFNGSTVAAPLTQTVNKAGSSLGLTTSNNPSVYGQAVTFTAALSALAPGSGTPTGTVTFLDGGTSIGTGTLSGGVATFSTSALAPGNHTITASYGGDSNFITSTASLTGNPQLVNKDASTSAVTSSANPSILGQSVTFTATISPLSPGAGTPTGTVTFLDGGTSIGTGTLAGGIATFSTSTLIAGNHTITASYGGDGNFIGSTGSLTGNPQVVTKGSATTLVTSSVNPSLIGQAVTFTATLTAVAPAPGSPTGTVTFLDGGTSIGTGTLSGGIATFSTSTLIAGNHTITTSYPGDSSFSSSTGALNSNPQVVNKANSSIALSSSTNPSIYGQNVTFRAVITALSPATGTPTGTVTFFDGGVSIGTGTLSGGIATFSTPALLAGSHSITATYNGDSNFNGSTVAAPLTQTVNKATSQVRLSSSRASTVYGQAVTFTAALSALAPGSGTPTGTVTFLDGGTSIGTGTLTAGVAAFTTSALATGNHIITASYGGDSNFNTSTTAVGLPHLVIKDNTANAVSSSANPSILGQSVTFTATISAVAPGAGTPTGSVTFLDGGTSIGTGTLSGGVATFASSTLATGNHTITTRYSGDLNFNGSTGSLTGNPQVVTKGSATSAVTSSANPSLIGQAVTFTATLSPVAPATKTPTGSVTFLADGVSIGSGTLSGGIATFTTSALALGNHTITTSYGGDSNFKAGTGALTGNPQVVIKGSSTLTLTSSRNPSALGQSITFTASLTSVAPATGTPTGTVTFLDGGIAIGTGTLNAGMAEFSTSILTAGNHTITASYSGDSNFNNNTGSMTGNPQVVVAPPVLSAVFSPASIVRAATSTLTITITNPSANTTALTGLSLSDSLPTGLTVTSASANACGGTVTTTAPGSIHFTGGNVAVNLSCTFNVTVIGAVEGIYSDAIGPISSTNGGTGNSTTASLTVQPAITLSPATLPAAQVGVAYSTTLSGNGGISPYTYSITSGALPAGLTFSTTGSITGTPTAGGTFNFTVTATDSLHFTGSQPYTLTVAAPTISITPTSLPNGQGEVAYSQTLIPSGGTAPYSFAIGTGSLPTGISLSPGGVLSGTPTAAGTFNFTVVVTDSSTGTGPYNATFSYSLFINLTTTTLTFGAISTQTYGNAPFAAVATSNSPAAITYSIISGPATISTSGLVTLAGAGTVTIAAAQPASSGYTSATAQTSFAVLKQNSAIALSATSTSITPGQSVTFTATVTPAVLGNPTGSVNFYDGAALLGNVALTAGTAAYSTSTLAPGATHNITASYSGDLNFNSSTTTASTPIIVAPLDFSILISGASYQSVLPGGSINYQIVVAPLYGQYAGTVNFTAAGLPPGATATFSPSSIQANGGPETVNITIQTAALSAAANPHPTQPASSLPGSSGPITLAFMTLFCIGAVRSRTRKLRRFLSSLAIIAGIASGLVLSGCGAGYFTAAPQSFNITITATSGNLQHSADLTLNVQ